MSAPVPSSRLAGLALVGFLAASVSGARAGDGPAPTTAHDDGAPASAHDGDASEAAFDHTYRDLDTFLHGAVHPDGVDYDLLATRRPLLDRFLGAVAEAPVDTFTQPQQVAFWVNAYNALTLGLILDERPLGSIRELNGGQVWKVRRFDVAGERRTLDHLEHQRARPLSDGRIHAVVNCASKGCPPLPPDPLRPDHLDAQLDEAAERWVATNAFTRTDAAVGLSRIFSWYSGDFTDWLDEEIPGAGPAQEAALGFLSAFGGAEVVAHARSEEVTIRWSPYDWSLNAHEASGR